MMADDSKAVWQLRNHPDVAKWMVNDTFIPFENHARFVENLKSDSSKDYFIIKDNEGNIIGSVNAIYLDNHLAERGIYVNPQFQGRGHAFKTLMEFYEELKSNAIRRVITRVKTDNLASNNLERKLGATLTECRDGYNFYMVAL